MQQRLRGLTAIRVTAADKAGEDFLSQVACIFPRADALRDIALYLITVFDEHARNAVGPVRVIRETHNRIGLRTHAENPSLWRRYDSFMAPDLRTGASRTSNQTLSPR